MGAKGEKMQNNYIDKLIERLPKLSSQKQEIISAVQTIVDMYKDGGKLLIAGNGGSSADCQHISGELLKGFISNREIKSDKVEKLSKYLTCEDIESLQEGIPAIPLTAFSGALTAYSNDRNSTLAFAQLVLALANGSDVFLAISTSGNSKNIIKATMVAKSLGLKVIALTGGDGGEIKKIADICIVAPEEQTYLVQEYHLPIYHAICAEVERILFA